MFLASKLDASNRDREIGNGTFPILNLYTKTIQFFIVFFIISYFQKKMHKLQVCAFLWGVVRALN